MTNPDKISRRGVMQLFAASALVSALPISTAAWAADLPVVIGGIAEDANLDPNNTSATDWLSILLDIYETAVTRDAAGEIVAGLATSWKQLDDVSWELSIRENVTFHDGSPFGADDVVYSYSRVLDKENKSPQRSYIASISSVEAVDRKTVRITLAQPDPLLLQGLLIVPIVKTGATKESLARATNGTGPYKLERWVPADQLSVVSAEGYWGQSPVVTNISPMRTRSPWPKRGCLTRGRT